MAKEKAKKRELVGLKPQQNLLLAAALLDDQATVSQLLADRANEELRRMNALADSLGMPAGESRWYLLALWFARKHHPALKEVKQDGRKRKWGAVEHAILAADLEREQRSKTPKKSQRDAANALAMRWPWKNFLSSWDEAKSRGADPGEALLAAYKDAKGSSMANKLREHERVAGDADWADVLMWIQERTTK
ncbi:hypothetical protein [Roseateles saccharophilus]|uniref:hypothetical protein n=1 Tax=Roseateles saccharophilus TaxID=304 RepID=UPI00104D7093|nr:hypothetical protein [Roseateles saccharophilus]MDG0834175.1 hypothetical protein [Roseateles saccharophilus]